MANVNLNLPTSNSLPALGWHKTEIVKRIIKSSKGVSSIQITTYWGKDGVEYPEHWLWNVGSAESG